MNQPSNAPASDGRKQAVVLSFDRLPLRLLGCYGSSMCQTPHLDRLAASAWTFDNHFSDDIRENRTTHSWWTAGIDRDGAATLPAALQQAGVRTTLLVDNPYADIISAAGFEHQLTAAPADEEAETLPPLLDRAAEIIADQQTGTCDGRLLWVHSSELPRLPVPPLDILELYLDELVDELDESEESAAALSPSQRTEALARISETMERLREDLSDLTAADVRVLSVLASAAVSALDRAIGSFIARLDAAGDVLFVLTADKGLSLGEARIASRLNPHRRDCPLADETVHVPLIVRPGRETEAERFSVLSQPADLSATLHDWFGLGAELGLGKSLLPVARGERDRVHDQILTRADGWNGLRDEEWLYVRSNAGDEQLFVRPDDRYQALDVLAQDVDEADRLYALLRAAVEIERTD